MRQLTSGSHVLDGEICVLDDQGRSDFMRLQERASRRGWREGADPVVFCAFDLLMLDGTDCRNWPLVDRKKALGALLAGKPASILFVDGLVEQGEAFYAHALHWMLVLPHEGMLPVSVCRRCAASMRCGTGDLLNLRADLACYRAIDFFVPASLLATNAL